MKKLLFSFIGVVALVALVLSSACKTPAQFNVTSLEITPNEMVAGESATVTVSVENIGGSEGIYHATLVVSGVEVETKNIPLAAGAKKDISFQITEDTPGTYEVELGGLARTFKALSPAEFKVVSLAITPNPAKVGGKIEIKIDVQNLGEIEGTYVASLIVDGIVEAKKETTVVGGVTKSVSFTISRDSPGDYRIEIGGMKYVIKVIQPVRLPTGTYLEKKLSGGLGELTIDNGWDSDAVAILASSKEPKVPLMAVYIRAGASHTIRKIRDSTYVLYFSFGEDWDNDSKKFIGKAVYQRFEDEFDFETTADTYTTYEVTLYPVIGGTAETKKLDEDEFPALD